MRWRRVGGGIKGGGRGALVAPQARPLPNLQQHRRQQQQQSAPHLSLYFCCCSSLR
jgi:hypothetical protein